MLGGQLESAAIVALDIGVHLELEILMPLTEGPQGRSSKFPTWLTLSLLRLVTDCHGPCRRVAVAL
jgi:hypothetical protein